MLFPSLRTCLNSLSVLYLLAQLIIYSVLCVDVERKADTRQNHPHISGLGHWHVRKLNVFITLNDFRMNGKRESSQIIVTSQHLPLDRASMDRIRYFLRVPRFITSCGMDFSDKKSFSLLIFHRLIRKNHKLLGGRRYRLQNRGKDEG